MEKPRTGNKLRMVGFGSVACSAVVFLGTTVLTPAVAQVKYPAGPIELIVTFDPGGAADSAARSLAPYLSKYLGVAVVVKNVPPPRTGTDIFSRSKPDGYTVGVLAGSAVASDEVFFKVRFRGREFAWIATNAATPGVLFANARGPIKSFNDIAKVAAERPVKIGAFSIYSSTTVATIIALSEKNIPFTFVTGFKGAAPAMTSLIRGEVDLVGTTIGSGSAFYKSGDARVLLLMQPDPDPQVPGAPTIGQVGLSPSTGYLGPVVFALVAPPGTGKEVRDILAAAHKNATDDPMYRAQLEKVGFTLSYTPPERVHEWLNNIYGAYEKFKPQVEAQVKKD